MIEWWWAVVIAMVSYCAGAVTVGTLLKSARNVEFEDRIVQALQDQALRDRLAEAPPIPMPPPEPPKD